MKAVLERVLDGGHLSMQEACEVVTALAAGGGQGGGSDAAVEPAVAGALLAALRAKGETAEEVAGFAMGMRAMARRPAVDAKRAAEAVDIVGTGGDGLGTYNLSTGAALLCAAAGLPVIKHGNRAISSQSGAADVLAALGLGMPLDEARAAACFEATGFTFLFAPHYHPAVGRIAAVRRTLGVRTIFNMLGPLTNPAQPGYGLIGAYSMKAAEAMAGAFAAMPIRRVLVVHADNGMDEPTPASPATVLMVTPGAVERTKVDAGMLGLRTCEVGELKGGNAEHNARAMRAVFAGEKSAHRDAVVMSAGLALWAAGRAGSAPIGVNMACAAIDDGRAAKLLDRLAKDFGPAAGGEGGRG